MSDLAYAEIYFGDKVPPSLLQVPGAKDIAVEFTSLSKTYSMPGWRMGFAAGNPRLINALTRMKSYLDYGAFTPIQVAAVAALNGPQDCVDQIRALYRERRDVLIRGLAVGGVGGAEPGGVDVRLGADPAALRRRWAASSSPSCCWRAPRWRCRRGWGSASTARGSCGSRWWRIPIGCARRCGISARSCRRGRNQAEVAEAAEG